MARTQKSQAFPKPSVANPTITNTQRTIAISLTSAQKAIHFLESRANKGEMAVHFVGKRTISKIHKQFFNDPSPTDCITFPSDEIGVLGEVFVCPQVAAEYVSLHGGNLYEEITLYLVHGYLHLLGFDDQTEEEEKKMRREEKKLLADLAKNNLLITT